MIFIKIEVTPVSRIAITAANTMAQLQKQLDVISHNVANVSTTGYKKQQATFHDLLYQQVNNQPERDTAERLTPPESVSGLVQNRSNPNGPYSRKLATNGTGP